MRRVVVVALGFTALFVGVLVAAASPAAAHANLEATEPAAEVVVDTSPSEVRLTFSEPVNASLGGIHVLAPFGSRVDDGTTTSSDGGAVIATEVDADAEGTYLVEWSVVSEDGHLLEGSFIYSVGQESAVAQASHEGRDVTRLLAGLARWTAYAGTLLLIGALVVRRLDARDTIRPRLATSATAGAAAVLGASALLLVTQVALAADRSLTAAIGLVPDAVVDNRTAGITAARTALALSALCVALLWRRSTSTCVPIALACTAAALATVPAIAGHPWTTSPRGLAVAVDALHVIVTGVWIGGLACLAVTSVSTSDGLARLRRFSPIAAVGLAGTVVTGVVSSFLQTRSVDALTDTTYGNYLIIKVGVVAVVAVIGLVNRRQLHLVDASARQRLIACEVALGAIVVVVTAILVNQPPARDALVRPIAVSDEDDVGSIEIQIEPARAGANDVHVYFYDDEGRPRPVDAAEIRVGRAGQPGRSLEVTPVTLEHVSAYDASFPASGQWEITVTSARSGVTATATVEVQIR